MSAVHGDTWHGSTWWHTVTLNLAIHNDIPPGTLYAIHGHKYQPNSQHRTYPCMCQHDSYRCPKLVTSTSPCHCVSLCVTTCHCVSPCVTMCHHVSPCVTVYNHVSPCVIVGHRVSCLDGVGATESRERGGWVEAEATWEGQRQGAWENTTGGGTQGSGKLPQYRSSVLYAGLR